MKLMHSKNRTVIWIKDLHQFKKRLNQERRTLIKMDGMDLQKTISNKGYIPLRKMQFGLLKLIVKLQ